jgi:hypothetical protein
MAIHFLTARQVQAAGAGDHADGGGLVLKVRDGRARWRLRFTNPAGQRRALGLGAVHRDSLAAAGASLSDAREAADKARKLLREGIDPIDATGAGLTRRTQTLRTSWRRHRQRPGRPAR